MASLKVPYHVGDLGGYLKEQREAARLSLRQLANAAGVSNPYLSQIERGMRRPSAEVLQQIAKGLQISAEALFLRAGLLEDSSGLNSEVALQSDVHLTARQKRVLLDIYATFRAENARAVAEAETEADSTQELGNATQAPIEELKSAATNVDGAGEPGGSSAAPKRAARKRAAAKNATTGTAAKTVRPARKRAAKSTRADS